MIRGLREQLKGFIGVLACAADAVVGRRLVEGPVQRPATATYRSTSTGCRRDRIRTASAWSIG